MVANPEDFHDALDACKREAMKGFADDAMLIEKFLTQPRHVEPGFCRRAWQRRAPQRTRLFSAAPHAKVLEELPRRA